MEHIMISIVVPVFNGESTLDRCVSSVLSQDYCNFELILVDDGSADGSLDMCESYGDGRIRVIHKENGGVSSARNVGISAASGDYILFLDCDDALNVGALRRVAEIAEGGYDLIACSLSVIRQDGGEPFFGFRRDVSTDNVFEMLLEEPLPFGLSGGKAVRTAFIREKGLLFDTSMHSQEDMRFFLQVYFKGGSFYLSPFESYRYYYSASTRAPAVKDHIENQVIAIDYAAKKGVSEEAIYVASDRLCRNLYAYLAYAADDRGVKELLSVFRQVEGIEDAVRHCTPTGAVGRFRYRFLRGSDGAVIRLMKNRRLIKRLLHRG